MGCICNKGLNENTNVDLIPGGEVNEDNNHIPTEENLIAAKSGFKKGTSERRIGKEDYEENQANGDNGDIVVTKKKSSCIFKKNTAILSNKAKLSKLKFEDHVDDILTSRNMNIENFEVSTLTRKMRKHHSLNEKEFLKIKREARNSVIMLVKKVSLEIYNLIKEVNFELEPNILTRSYMEDFINIENILDKDGISLKFYVLSDGHNGALAAKVVVEKLPSIFSNNLKTEDTVEEAIEKSFPEMDTELRTINIDDSGCTCNLIYLRLENGKKVVYSGNVGDSRSILLKSDKVVRLSYDHKAKDKTEAKRVKRAGGLIIRGRFYGNLAITRTLADFEIKDDTSGLSCKPHITRTEIEDSDRYIIIASDGVWDEITDSEAFDIVAEYEEKIKENPMNMNMEKYIKSKD